MRFLVFWEAFLGAAKCGVVLAPINWRLAPKEIATILADSQAKLLIAENQFLEPLRETDNFDPPEILTLDGDGEGGFAVFRDSGSTNAPDHKPDPGDAVVQLYTSGTTGLPKGVVLPHRCFYEVGDAGLKAEFGIPTSEEEAIMHALPHFHIAGVCYGLIAFTRSMPLHQHRAFDPAKILQEAESGPPLHAFVVPAMILMLLETAKATGAVKGLAKFTSVAYGAAPMPEPLLDAAMASFPNAEFYQLYGMTETTGGVTMLPPEAHAKGKKERIAAGLPLPGCEIKILDPDNGEEKATGETGEIVVRAPFAMDCYWNRQDATDEVLKDGWYYSGDAGYFDKNGFLYVVDRIKDMVISGGENIYPAELESVLASHPNIREAAIIGAPDERWGEIVKAVVATRDGKEMSVDEINAFLDGKVAKFKLPREVQTIEALPRNASGKILKTELRKGV